jgi:putative phage-type endonuclease
MYKFVTLEFQKEGRAYPYFKERDEGGDAREAWLKERNKGIGGSDAAAILGLNPYKTNIRLWEEKTGRRKADDVGDKAAVQFGRSAEEHITALYALDNPQYEIKTEPYKIYVHPQYPYIIGTLDGAIYDKTTEGHGILEIKTATVNSAAQMQKWTGVMPKNYEVQLYHYLLVTGYNFAVLKARIKYKDEVLIREYRVERDTLETLANIDFLLAKEREFWEEYVLKDKYPPLALPPI